MTRDGGPGRAADYEATLATLRLGIAKRVLHICAHMSSPDFDEMVASMARIQHKYEVLSTRSFGRAPAF